ncbi:hypothetical protein LguiB_009885 [Lonicera macranthoides]
MSDHVVCRDFKLTLVSTTYVEHVRNIFKTKVYVAVTIGDNKETKKQTSTDKFNETNPKWNHTMECTIAATDVQNPGLDLLIKSYIDRGVTKGLVTLEYSFGEEKSVKKLSLVKKLVNAGTSMAVKATITSSTGVYVSTPIHVFREPEIVCSKATASAHFGGEFLLDAMLEVVQNM